MAAKFNPDTNTVQPSNRVFKSPFVDNNSVVPFGFQGTSESDTIFKSSVGSSNTAVEGGYNSKYR